MNPDIFDDLEADVTSRSTYVVELEIRTADGDVKQRIHVNVFPELLAAPVY